MPASSTRARRDALIGALLALGAPLGLLLVRAPGAPRLSLAWLRGELLGDAPTYLYVVLSTLAVFALFGLLLGRQADRLYELSSEDPLTGLGNRRRFQARLEEEFARAQRYGAPLSVLVADLDGLKELNDRCGHRIGDEALTRVASAIRTGSRAADFAARWGGDEFALLAPSTGSEDAVRLAERVRSLASEHDSGRERISVSIGVATFDPKSGTDSAEGLMRQADAALYAAKAAGRDRVVVG